MTFKYKVFSAFGSTKNRRIVIGLTTVQRSGNILKVTHTGNMGNSISNSINPNLEKAGFPSIEEMKKEFLVIKKSGSPDYMYSIEFNMGY